MRLLLTNCYTEKPSVKTKWLSWWSKASHELPNRSAKIVRVGRLGSFFGSCAWPIFHYFFKQYCIYDFLKCRDPNSGHICAWAKYQEVEGFTVFINLFSNPFFLYMCKIAVCCWYTVFIIWTFWMGCLPDLATTILFPHFKSRQYITDLFRPISDILLVY